MSTSNDKEFDYYTYMKEHDPDMSRIHQGSDARQQRFEETVMKHRVRLDEDIIEQFQQLAARPRKPDRDIGVQLLVRRFVQMGAGDVFWRRIEL